MNEERFEHFLADALANRPQALDPAAVGRLTAGDYRGRARRQRRRRTSRAVLAVAVGCAFVAGLVIALTGTGAVTATAQASWVPFPRLLSAAHTAREARACVGEPPPASATSSTLYPWQGLTYRPALAEQRGSTIALVGPLLGSAKRLKHYISVPGQTLVGICLATKSSGTSDVGMTASAEGPNAHADTAQTVVLSVSISDGSGATLMAGRVGSDVRAVWLTGRSGGPATIWATVSDGWYLVWWPQSQHPRYLVVRTDQGTRAQLIPPGAIAGLRIKSSSGGRSATAASVTVSAGG